jgi:hypothetical protein
MNATFEVLIVVIVENTVFWSVTQWDRSLSILAEH